MSYNLVAAGSDKKANGDAKFFEFAAANLKAEDYPHLPSTSVGSGETKRSVPVVKISPASILVREYPSIADAEDFYVSTKGVTLERFQEVVLSLLNKEERDEAVKISRTRVSEAKIIDNMESFYQNVADDVNICAEAEGKGGRESFKAKQEKAQALLTSGLSQAELAVEFAKLLGVTL